MKTTMREMQKFDFAYAFGSKRWNDIRFALVCEEEVELDKIEKVLGF